MYDTTLDDTKQTRAFNRMMDRNGPRPAAYTTLYNIRIDGVEEFERFCNKHDFITHVINYDGDSFDVEYLA
jgi:hypothetical protein